MDSIHVLVTLASVLARQDRPSLRALRSLERRARLIGIDTTGIVEPLDSSTEELGAAAANLLEALSVIEALACVCPGGLGPETADYRNRHVRAARAFARGATLAQAVELGRRYRFDGFDRLALRSSGWVADRDSIRFAHNVHDMRHLTAVQSYYFLHSFL